VFYLIVAFGLAAWGSFICWQANEEEEIKEEVYHHFKQTQSN
jgi:hypothetical protein